MLIPFKTLLAKYNFRPTGVFHIGASTGQEAIDYNSAGIINVVWVEAIPYVFEELKKQISRYPRMVAINECISDEDGKEVSFNVASNGGQSSSILALGTHKQAHPEVHYTSSFVTKTKRIDTLLKETELSLSNYDFLNIDLQGAELLALKGMGEELHKVNHIYIEVNKAELYVGCPLINDIDEYLHAFGFERKETVWCGNTNWGDAYYKKFK